MKLRRRDNGSTVSSEHLACPSDLVRGALSEAAFHRMISLERKRSERSRKPFLLMLVDMGDGRSLRNREALGTILVALTSVTRETDLAGWYENDRVVGAMFTEIGSVERAILSTMITRVSDTLKRALSTDQFSQVNLSFHMYPEDWDHETHERPTNPVLYPDLSKRDESRKFLTSIKRAVDIVGSLAALIILAPAFLVIALAIKLSSRGPVLFKQRRIGQHGTPFVFLKFRSMYVDNDAAEHRNYVRQLIKGDAKAHLSNESTEGVYKITNDSRITKVGAFLRRTSLDELPQFVNVLKGEMSLVGPRPPLPYEVEAYDFWHRSRLLEAKPGITGSWQVSGRSRVKFDDMVRMDLRYARQWSLWLDLKILLRTPRAVVSGEGSY